jgi:two-component system cell cycle sensor histidine kinase/response regulator CckA
VKTSDVVRVLYAEDNAQDADLTSSYFRVSAPEFEIDVAPTGRRCLAMLQQGRYDVLLLDNHLPDMDGIDVLKELAAGDMSIPIVMVTAVGDEDLVVQVLRLGAVDYVSKEGDYVESLPAVLRHAVADRAASADQPPVGTRRQRRILYVERDEADIDLTRTALAAAARHLTLEIVSSGREALQRAQANGFDLILADLRLSDMSGLDLLREARHRGLQVPFIVITGRGDEGAAVAALKLGAYDYIVKREGHLTQLPYAIDNAIDRWKLVEANRRLHAELAERTRAQAENARLVREITGQRQRLDEIVASVPGLVWEAWGRPGTADLRVAFISGHVERMLGYSVEQCLLAPGFLLGVIHPEDRDRAVAEAADSFSSGTGGISRFRLIARDGRAVWVESRTTVIVNANGQPVGMRGVTMDITAAREAERAKAHLEEELRQAQKIESVGRLAGGIAHDFNNLLTAINGYADLMLDELPPGDRWRASITEIRRAGERAAELTGQLLAFSRRQLLQPRVIDLNALIADSTKMLGRLLGEDIELITMLDSRLGHVTADAGQVHQIVLNLALNARDAMPQGGKLILETQNVAFEEDLAQQHPSITPGSYVMLAVSDNGCGMDQETLSHIFEPFFTTKEPTKGTGLGLSTVYGIVKQSGGSIFVYSEPGNGATFKIYLPRIDQPVSRSREQGAESETLRGSETVLVVEDEEVVRKLIDQALRKYGYEVLEAASGAEALQVCEAHRTRIPLMITDVVMPQMSGRELAARLRDRHPETRVLYMSGYTDDAVVRHGLLDASMSFLQKPFTPGVLVRKVREALDQRA